MKNYIEATWGSEEKPSYDKLRRYVKETRVALPDSYWRELLNSMPERCRAVIEAHRIHTKH